LPDYLARHGIPGISQIDTRALTRRLREKGVLHAALCTDGSHTSEELLALARNWEGLDGRDLVKEVTCQEPYHWIDGTRVEWTPVPAGKEVFASQAEPAADAPLVVAYDFGIKHNILRRLTSHGLRVTVVPAHTTAAEVLAMRPDGIFLSNGPGDPAGVPYAAQAVKELLESRIPTFGICLGHQIIGLAVGGETYKLKFGHHGSNQPVGDVDSTNVQITAQNHNYAVREESLPENLEVTHRNLNDGTVEGLRFVDRPVFCVQYHPEASPGPHDADLLFARFARLVKEHAHEA
jgi:carbamoyl-phosphate synthase small subunit